MPVIVPLDKPIDKLVDEVLQVPPVTELVTVIADPRHTWVGPVIVGGNGLIVNILVVIQPVTDV